jgi:hypothetical protein
MVVQLPLTIHVVFRNLQENLVMAFTNETLAGGIIILTALTGAVVAFCMAQDSGKYFQGPPRGNFLERAATPSSTPVFLVKKVERNGKELAYLIKLGEKGNLNTNKNHPTKTPLGLSPEN